MCASGSQVKDKQNSMKDKSENMKGMDCKEKDKKNNSRAIIMQKLKLKGEK